jgi:hypothetical protein
MTIRGKVWKYGDDVNTDVIFPGKYTYTITDRTEMAAHALEDLDPTFAKEVKPGDIVVAGRNFGCGSSREQAATCLKEAGVAAVVAARPWRWISRAVFCERTTRPIDSLGFPSRSWASSGRAASSPTSASRSHSGKASRNRP